MERGWIEMIVPSYFPDKYLLSHASLPAHHFWHIPLRWLLWRSGSIERQWAMKESFPRDLIMICYSLLWNWKCTLPLSILQGGVPRGRDDRIEPCGQWCPCDLQVLALLHLLSIQIKSFVEGMLEEVTERTWLPVDTRAEAGESDNGRFLTPSLVLGMHILLTVPTVGAIPRTQPWESNVLLRPSGLNMWLNPVKGSISAFNILPGRCGDLLVLWLPRQMPYVSSLAY